VLQKNNVSVAERFKILAESEYKGEMVAGAGTTRSNISRTLQSVLGTLPTMDDLKKSTHLCMNCCLKSQPMCCLPGEKWTVEQGIKKLRELDYHLNQVKAARQSLVDGNAVPFKKLQLACARQQVLNEVQFNQLTDIQAKNILRVRQATVTA